MSGFIIPKQFKLFAITRGNFLTDRSIKADNELKFPSQQGYFDRSLTVRLIIATLFTLALFFFLHLKEVHVEPLELDSVAKKYVVAQVDFDFLDHEATSILQQEAVRDIGKIYQLPGNQVRNRRLEIEKNLMLDDKWRAELPTVNAHELFSGLELYQKALAQLRLTDPRTLHILEEASFDTFDYQIFPSTTEEESHLPDYIWAVLEENTFVGASLPEGIGKVLTQQFQQFSWKLEEDIIAERNIRKKIQSEVPNKYTHVNAGDRIVDQGQRVTPRHLAMLQAMKKVMGERRNLLHPSTIVGSFILAFLMTFLSGSYLFYNHPQTLSSNRKLFLISTVILLVLVLSRGVELWGINAKGHLAEVVRYPLFVPLAAILVCHLINAGVATFVAAFLTIFLTMTQTLDLTGMVMNLVASLVSILETRTLRLRKEIFVVCAKAWLACTLVIASVHLYDNTLWDVSTAADLISAAGFMLLTAVLVIGLLPLFETLFHVVTDVTLMEYMDPNHELLRRLSIEAPGTYQHSLVIGTLAEAAALAIGANGLFCRVSTLYHDVGKMATPQYFTENQQGGVNIHQLLTPQESAQVIMAHVNEGVGMARKAGVPEQFIDIIKEHHGTTLVYYFYHQALEQVGGDKSLVNEKEFRYSGPKPYSKESAIIMIADSFEAASRSLEEVTEATLEELIDRLINVKLQDGQFDNCLLTFHDLAIVKKTMVQTLMAAGHARIKYPKQ